MTRRKFLQICGVGCLATAVPFSFLQGLQDIWERVCNSLFRRQPTKATKEAIIAKALGTPEGRQALAQAMVEPIRRSLDYQAVGRKLLLVDELPRGVLAA